MLLDSFARFALQGLGMPAPIFPTQHLVVSGLFRHVRNPMYVAVLSLILGQGIAVVEQVNGRWIQVTLWNKSTLRIARKDVAWDEQNMRWETGLHACIEANGKA